MRFKKGDRVTVRLNRDNISINRMIYGIQGDIVDIEIVKVNDGYNIWTHTDRNGYNRYNYITRKTFEEKGYQFGRLDSKVCSYNIMLSYQNREIIFEVADKDILEVIKYGIPKNLDFTIQKAIDYCTLNSDDCDIVKKAITKYKKLRELDSKLQEEVRALITTRLRNVN